MNGRVATASTYTAYASADDTANATAATAAAAAANNTTPDGRRL